MKRLPPFRTYSPLSRARGRAHRGGVGAGARLGERVRGEPFARRELRQEALLLLVAARELEPERAELLHGDDQAARRADLRHLLDRDERHQCRRADAAVLLVEQDPEDLVLAEELDDVPRELGALVDLRGARRDALAREVAHEVADLALLVGQRVDRHARQVYAGNYGCRFSATPDPLRPSLPPRSDEPKGAFMTRIVVRPRSGRRLASPRGNREPTVRRRP